MFWFGCLPVSTSLKGCIRPVKTPLELACSFSLLKKANDRLPRCPGVLRATHYTGISSTLGGCQAPAGANLRSSPPWVVQPERERALWKIPSSQGRRQSRGGKDGRRQGGGGAGEASRRSMLAHPPSKMQLLTPGIPICGSVFPFMGKTG